VRKQEIVARSKKAVLVVASIAMLVIGLLAVWPRAPPTPPLLRGVTAASGWLGGGSLFQWQIDASVYWKIDEARKIVWTKGFVMYISL